MSFTTRITDDGWRSRGTDADEAKRRRAIDEEIAAAEKTEDDPAGSAAQITLSDDGTILRVDADADADIMLAIIDVESFHLGGQHSQKSHACGSTEVSSSDPDTLLNSASQTFEDRATPEMRNAQRAYIGSDYRTINGALRGDTELDAATAQHIQGLDDAFQRTAIHSTQPVTLGRDVGRRDPILGASVGDEVTSDGYVSTRARSPGDANLVITVPPGTPMLSGSSSEAELILDRGTRYRVTDRREDGRDVFLEVEVI